MNPIRILVVDDEPVVGKDVQMTLERLGYSVPLVATSGSEAIDIVRRTKPDLVIMDVRLQGPIDGIEAAIAIRNESATPLIYLTAFADEETIARAKATEPYGYVLKPFNDRELQSTVEMALSRSRSEQRMQVSRDRFQSALSSMADGVIATNLVGNINFMNPIAEAITGWSAAEALGKPLQDVFRITTPAGESAPALSAPGAAARPILLMARDRSRVAIEDNSAPMKDRDGSLTGLVVVFRRRHEDAKDPTGANLPDDGAAPPLAGVIEGIADPLIAVDIDWHITFVNAQAARYFDKQPDEMIGRDVWDEFPSDVHAKYYNEYYQALTRRERRAFEIHAEEMNVWFEVTAYPFGDGLLILLKDITARKSDEARLRKVEKLESLGLLARGFAHDFNNLLTVLLGNISLAQMKLPDGAEGRMEVDAAKEATLQAQNRVQQLLTFAKGGAPVRTLVDSGRFIDDFLKSRRGADGVAVIGPIDRDLWWSKIDKSQITRLLDNLLRNAEQAMPLGGKVTLSAENLPAGSEKRDRLPAAIDLDEDEHYLLLRVADDGSGIEDAHLPKVFEPYFSTRRDANATGIGLTVCESIARGHHGAIAVESEGGRGTTVTVCLPALGRSKDQLQGDESAAAPSTRDGSARVLILEDEEMIRQLLVAQLTKNGFEVDEAKDGAAAVARYIEAHDKDDPYCLLIMDLSIPNGMGGAKALEEIRQVSPDVLAIVSSGYSDDPVMADPKRYGFSGVLPKPYQPNDLLAVVREVLGKHRCPNPMRE